jgi:hypothetical protein
MTGLGRRGRHWFMSAFQTARRLWRHDALGGRSFRTSHKKSQPVSTLLHATVDVAQTIIPTWTSVIIGPAMSWGATDGGFADDGVTHLPFGWDETAATALRRRPLSLASATGTIGLIRPYAACPV